MIPLADPPLTLAILAIALVVILRPRPAEGRGAGPAGGQYVEMDYLPAVVRALQLIGVAPAEALKGVSINIENRTVFDLGVILPPGLRRAYDKARDALDPERLDVDALMADLLEPIAFGAGRGDPEMNLLLAHIRRGGLGVPVDVDEALRLVRLAAETGHLVAANILGEMLLSGQGTLPDFDEGVGWLRRARPLGAAKTLEALWYARMFRPDLVSRAEANGTMATAPSPGDGVASGAVAGNAPRPGYPVYQFPLDAASDAVAGPPPGFCNTAGDLRVAVVRDGRSGDLFVLGMRLLFGPAEERDEADGVDAFRQLASRGEDVVATLLARIYREGVPGVPRDEAEADKWALAAKRFREERLSRDASPEAPGSPASAGGRPRPGRPGLAGRDEKPQKPRRPRKKPPLR